MTGDLFQIAVVALESTHHSASDLEVLEGIRAHSFTVARRLHKSISARHATGRRRNRIDLLIKA